MQEFPRSSANFPYTLVRAPPIVPQPFQQAANVLPLGRRERMAGLHREIRRRHHLAVNIELKLRVSCLANPHQPRILIPPPMIEANLGHSVPPIPPLHGEPWPPLSLLAP